MTRHYSHKEKIAPIQKQTNYFSTPSTTIGHQKQVYEYDESFDPHVDSYKRSGTKPIIKTYVIR